MKAHKIEILPPSFSESKKVLLLGFANLCKLGWDGGNTKGIPCPKVLYILGLEKYSYLDLNSI